MTEQQTQAGKRHVYMELLRIVAAFLVIVNHTNSQVFQASDPTQIEWYLSVAWYYVSKLAVPLFVMISGALLLNRRDSYKRALGRVGRMVGALVVFSYGYFLYDAWVNYGLWPRAVQFGAFFGKVWGGEITDGFWYLYFYTGLLIALPLLQRLAAGMDKRDTRYLMGMSFGIGAVWPLMVHYVPGLALQRYFDVPLVSGYVGLFFAGHYVHNLCEPPKKGVRAGCWVALALSVGVSLLLTMIEYGRVGQAGKYWFMDDRMTPSVFTIVGTVAVMMLAKSCEPRLANSRGARVICGLGTCAFGIYLLQDWIIAKSEPFLFEPLCGVMPAFAAVMVWEIAVFVIALAAAWVLKKIPGLKQLM